MIDEELKKELAKELYEAEVEHRLRSPLVESYPELTAEDAYSIQLELVKRKLTHGCRIVGKKVGFTTDSVQKKLGLHEPGYGYLLNSMEVLDGGEVQVDRLFQPKVEAEISFILHSNLRGPKVSIDDVISATRCIVPTIEIIDSRIKGWMVSLADTISDNALSGLYVKGYVETFINGIDLSRIQMSLERNGEVILTGTGSAVLGNPALSVAWLANKLSEVGGELKGGELILSGSFCAPLAVCKGDRIKVSFKDIGSVAVNFV